jgi:hypothetical protein
MSHDDYSLNQLEECIDDTLHSAASPEEIHDVLIKNVKKNIIKRVTMIVFDFWHYYEEIIIKK